VSGNGLGFEENLRPLPAVSTYDDQHHTHGFDDQQDTHSSPNPLHISQPFNGIPPDAGANPRGSRFAKFFDGKPREMAPGPGKAAAYTSPSPNPGHRPEHLGGPIDAPVEHRGIEDLFAMLQNSQVRAMVLWHTRFLKILAFFACPASTSWATCAEWSPLCSSESQCWLSTEPDSPPPQPDGTSV